ncbi:MAG: hypothetical protein QXS54_06585 [Candidatus Methanomethylicaceae archaeon]
MERAQRIKEKITKVFPQRQAEVLFEVVDVVEETVKVSDFTELKNIVAELAKTQKELAEAQKRTEQRVEELAQAQKRTEQRVEELAKAQKRTEQRVEELAKAQKRTEQRVEELAKAQAETQREIRALVREMRESRSEFGNFQRTMSYAFENEAYRMLPSLLKEKYGIHVYEKFVRADIKGKEINFLARGRTDGKEVLIVGEGKLKLDDRLERMKIKRKQKDVFTELDEKVDIVKEEYKTDQIVKLLVTHFATKGFIEMANERGVIVVQSYEW